MTFCRNHEIFDQLPEWIIILLTTGIPWNVLLINGKPYLQVSFQIVCRRIYHTSTIFFFWDFHLFSTFTKLQCSVRDTMFIGINYNRIMGKNHFRKKIRLFENLGRLRKFQILAPSVDFKLTNFHFRSLHFRNLWHSCIVPCSIKILKKFCNFPKS